MTHQHYILYKPYNFLSQFVNNQTKRRNKRLLGELGAFAEGTMAIGRLDEKSEGLLLLTTDGKVSEHIRSKNVEKEYYVEVEGIPNDEIIEQLQNGVEISIYGKPYKTQACTIRVLDTVPKVAQNPGKKRSEGHGPTSWVSITLTEGKFRQIRKMTAAVGHPTFRLIRMRMGKIKLDGLAPGDYYRVDCLKV
jgi:23S rRNA pseudouridine2457 synthase